jgi:hypothetical protein
MDVAIAFLFAYLEWSIALHQLSLRVVHTYHFLEKLFLESHASTCLNLSYSLGTSVALYYRLSSYSSVWNDQIDR